jgi:hypothetical protein
MKRSSCQAVQVTTKLMDFSVFPETTLPATRYLVMFIKEKSDTPASLIARYKGK